MILFGVSVLLALTVGTAVVGIVLASGLMPGDSPSEARFGLLAVLPVLWVWKAYLNYLGLTVSGLGWRKK
ncbi:MAG: hypothetical protein MK160_05475 [Rhodobacteraceae bacterium]|nr:hypothetical protein [Paracoccaceae bacterium]